MQERKFSSAFRVSSKQYDSLKMQNSLDQLLGEHSRKIMGDHLQDSDIEVATPPSTSTLLRSSAGPRTSTKDKSSIGFKSSSESLTNSNFGQNIFTPELGIFVRLRNALDELAQQKKCQSQGEHCVARIFADQKKDLNSTIKLDKDVGFLQSIINSLTQQSSNYLPPFALETLKDESNKQQQVFYTKLEQLHSLDQQLAFKGQASDSKKTASHQKSASFKVDNNKMDIQTKRETFQDVSSLNSLDEEIEMNTKPTARLNHLSISSASQLEDLSLRTVNSDTSTPTKFHQLSFDCSNSTLQQRLEFHHAKNRHNKSSNDEALEGRGSSSLGAYPLDERIRKILHYKKKIIKWRAAHPPNRNFSGRSAVAGSKPRIKGKFVKKDEYQKYMEVQKKTAN